MSATIPCTGLGRWFGHRYEARYDRDLVPRANPGGFSTLTGTDLHDHYTYVHDICVRCGHVIGRTTGT